MALDGKQGAFYVTLKEPVPWVAPQWAAISIFVVTVWGQFVQEERQMCHFKASVAEFVKSH